MLKLPENFENYADARKAGFLKMKDLKEAGQKIVGIYCTFVPTELVEEDSRIQPPPVCKCYESVYIYRLQGLRS